MLKISGKAKKLYDKACKQGLLDEENFAEADIEAWQATVEKMSGDIMFEDRERCCNVFLDLNGTQHITAFHNDDGQWYVWAYDEPTLIEQMNKWIHKLQKLFDRA